MKNSLNFKTNLLLILMTIFYFFILFGIILANSLELNAIILIIFFAPYYIIIFIIVRYIVLIRNFYSIFLNQNDKKDKKIIFYGNIFDLLFYFYNIFIGLNIFPVFNYLLIYPEIIIVTLCDILVLYSVIKEVINNRLLKYIIRIILLLITIFNILLLFNDKYIDKLLIIP